MDRRIRSPPEEARLRRSQAVGATGYDSSGHKTWVSPCEESRRSEGPLRAQARVLAQKGFLNTVRGAQALVLVGPGLVLFPIPVLLFADVDISRIRTMDLRLHATHVRELN